MTTTHKSRMASALSRHCERSEAIQTFFYGKELDCFAALAMTTGWILHIILGSRRNGTRYTGVTSKV